MLLCYVGVFRRFQWSPLSLLRTEQVLRNGRSRPCLVNGIGSGLVK